ncbi:UNVERIFIED_CONTAM: hypothetical protein K2H54_025840 [Gekko kuhli]
MCTHLQQKAVAEQQSAKKLSNAVFAQGRESIHLYASARPMETTTPKLDCNQSVMASLTTPDPKKSCNFAQEQKMDRSNPFAILNIPSSKATAIKQVSCWFKLEVKIWPWTCSDITDSRALK